MLNTLVLFNTNTAHTAMPASLSLPVSNVICPGHIFHDPFELSVSGSTVNYV